MHVTDPVPIGDWLSTYKLTEYIPQFEAAGYESTDFLQGISSDELVEIGVTKPGHKKKILSALSSLRHKEHLIMSKPVSWEEGPSLLGGIIQDIDFQVFHHQMGSDFNVFCSVF